MLAVRVARAGLAEPVAQAALAGPVVRVALAELVSQVALAELVSQVAQAGLVVPAELELNREEEPELGLVEVVPERDPVAVLVKSKSVTALHRHGQVRVPKRVEDLAVGAAETTPEQAAIEAEKAWAAVE